MNINATVLGQVISFIFFVWFCMKYVWYPLISIIERRQQEISDSLESVEKSKMETEHAKSEALSCLKQARITAQEIIKHAYKCQVQILHEAQYEANRERNILFQAKEQVNQERKRVSDKLRKKVSQLVMEAIERIVEQSITEIVDTDVIDRIINKIPFGDSMCNTYTIAYEYAKAIFDLSMEQNSFRQIRLILEFCAKVSQNNLIQSLCFRMIESKRISTIFIAVYEDYYQKQLSDLGYKIIHIMAKNRRILLFPMVSKKFNDLSDKYLRFLKAEIISACILNDNELQKITETMTHYLSKTVKVVCHVNNNILAGIIIRIGDTVIDGSLSSRISRLRNIMGC